MEKKGFVFYMNWADRLREMPPQLRHDTIDALLDYATTGALPADDNLRYGFWSSMRDTLDRDMAKWHDIKRKRSQAGRRGSAARWAAQPVADDGGDDPRVLLGEQAKACREQFCMTHGITEQQFAMLLNETLNDWQMAGVAAENRNRAHLLATIRIKAQQLKHTHGYGTNQPARGGGNFMPTVTGFNIIEGTRPGGR